MGTAALLLAIFIFSALAVRLGATALRLTGVPPDVARFQARSAFTGTGFTTSESEGLVNHPVRRQILNYLIILGNVGLVGVLATVVVSFVEADNTWSGFMAQALWFSAAIVLFWLLALNPIADRLICAIISLLLHRFTELGHARAHTALQVSPVHSVAEYHVEIGTSLEGVRIEDLKAAHPQVLPLGVRHQTGEYLSLPPGEMELRPGDVLLVYADQTAHAGLATLADRREGETSPG